MDLVYEMQFTNKIAWVRKILAISAKAVLKAKPVKTPAEWSYEPCPKCGAPFVARDKFGLFCCMSGCDWKEKSQSLLWGEQGNEGGNWMSIGAKSLLFGVHQILAAELERRKQKALLTPTVGMSTGDYIERGKTIDTMNKHELEVKIE